MAEKISPCKFCGKDVEWYEYGKPPRDPITKQAHKCKSQSSTTAASDSTQVKDKTESPNQQKERKNEEIIQDWMFLNNKELSDIRRDLELSIRYNRITMRAINFLSEQLEKKGMIEPIKPEVRKEVFTEPIDEMEKRLDMRHANISPKN